MSLKMTNHLNGLSLTEKQTQNKRLNSFGESDND